MKAIQIEKTYSDLETSIKNLEIVEKPIPKPGPGQVLVKIEAAPCNPSDLLFLQGKYGVNKTFPAVPGWEGSGTVVENGGGILGWWLKGKRVACAGQSDSDGTWAEYYVTDAKACIPLNKKVSYEQGSTIIVNPMTAFGMIEQAKSEGHKGIIQTAACSQVGKMVQTLARKNQIPLINIVRRKEQVKELESAGEKWVLNSEDEYFLKKLKTFANDLNATIVFEAVAGNITGQILNVMPANSKALIYGALSEKPCNNISPLGLIFENKKVEGFWLKKWIEKSGIWHTFQTTRFIQNLIETKDFETKIREKVEFEKWQRALLDYQNKMTEGKVILKPNLSHTLE